MWAPLRAGDERDGVRSAIPWRFYAENPSLYYLLEKKAETAEVVRIDLRDSIAKGDLTAAS